MRLWLKSGQWVAFGNHMCKFPVVLVKQGVWLPFPRLEWKCDNERWSIHFQPPDGARGCGWQSNKIKVHLPTFYVRQKQTSVFVKPASFFVSLLYQLKQFLTNTEVDVKTILYSIYNLFHITILKLTMATMHIILYLEYYFMHTHSFWCPYICRVNRTFYVLL